MTSAALILAQSGTTEPAPDWPRRLLETLARFELPSRREYVEAAAALGPLQAVALLAAGVIFLVYGFRYFKMLVVLNAAAVGALVGAHLGHQAQGANMPMLLGLAGAVLLGVLAWPALKYTVGLMGALAGGLIGLCLWALIARSAGDGTMAPHAWIGGVLGMVTVGLLTFVVFRQVVMILTAFQGALMLLSGSLGLLLARPSVEASIRPDLEQNEYLLAVLLGVPAIVGFVFQFATESAKIAKKRKATEKPPV